MITNPSTTKSVVIEGTRLLVNDFGLIGVVLYDPIDGRGWQVLSVYAPLDRALGGIRVKCSDEKDFVSFLNQRDLELLTGEASPGDWCRWLGDEYPDVNSREFVGFCMDSEDIADDLYDRELLLRAIQEGTTGSIVLPNTTEIEQRLHLGHNNDVIRRSQLLYDMDPTTGMYPDTRMETMAKRWVAYDTERVEWNRM